MPRVLKLSRADAALDLRSSQVRDEYLRFVKLSGAKDLTTLKQDLQALGILSSQDDTEDLARDIAEKTLLTYIGDEEVTALFYEIRRRCV